MDNSIYRAEHKKCKVKKKPALPLKLRKSIEITCFIFAINVWIMLLHYNTLYYKYALKNSFLECIIMRKTSEREKKIILLKHGT